MDGHIIGMSRPSNRDKILTEGLRVVHAHGFGGASVRDIVQAAGVPQGSFTNHFTSKEAFALEIIDLYFADGCLIIDQTLCNQALPPLQRLRAYVDALKHSLDQNGVEKGCLLGNFTAEACDQSAPIRDKLLGIYAEVERAVAECLQAAVAAGELAQDFDYVDVAGFITASLQGANLMSKAQRSTVPVERFERVLFGMVLRNHR